MKRRTKVILVSLMMLGAFAYLISLGIKEGSMFYFEVSEYTEKLPSIASEHVRVNGEVVWDTVEYNAKLRRLTFTLKDTKGPERLQIEYIGTPPDLVEQEGVTVVAEGSYRSTDNVFVSSKLLIKCPSKYEKKEDSRV
jgi:cytochrome c-type biogenesis protein CcmE